MMDPGSAVDNITATDASTRLNGEIAQVPSTIPVADVPAALPGDSSAVAKVPSTDIMVVPPTHAPIRVIDIRKNLLDDRGEKIDFVFFRRRDFAIYRSGGKIMVQYSDDEGTAQKQIAGIAELMPLRDCLQYLVKDMAAPQSYHRQIAEALRLGLNGQKDAAISTMQAAISDITTTRQRKGRTTYLLCAWVLVVGAVVLLSASAAAIWILCDPGQDGVTRVDHLMMATGSGAVGALLSTAIALRARTVAVDGDLKSNALDSTTRIMIGVISAAVLYLILDSKLLDNVVLGAMTLKPDLTWQVALLAGFAAGFLERLVPDLLEKKLAPIAK